MRTRIVRLVALLLLLCGLLPSRVLGQSTVGSDDAVKMAAERLRILGVVHGDDSSGLKLRQSESITRAELAVLMVRAFGRADAATGWRGTAPFADVPAESWHARWIATAKTIATERGVTLGAGNGTYAPDRPVSRVEALVLALKLVGWTAAGTKTAWYEPWLDRALYEARLTEAEAAALRQEPDRPATRGEAFWLVDKVFFAKLLPGGASVYTRFQDGLPPDVSLAATPPTETTEASIQINGYVVDNRGVLGLALNGRPVPLEGDRFQITESLPGVHNSLTLTATDLAGNTFSRTFVVKRVRGEAASLTVTPGLIELAVDESVPVDVTVRTAAGDPLPIEITSTSALGTFKDGHFTAGSVVGAGSLKLTAGGVTKAVSVLVRPGFMSRPLHRSGAPGERIPVAVWDQYGNRVTDLGVTVETEGGHYDPATGLFWADRPGSYRVKVEDLTPRPNQNLTDQGRFDVVWMGVPGVPTRAELLPFSAWREGEDWVMPVQVVDANGSRVRKTGESITVYAWAGVTLLSPNVKDSEHLNDLGSRTWYGESPTSGVVLTTVEGVAFLRARPNPGQGSDSLLIALGNPGQGSGFALPIAAVGERRSPRTLPAKAGFTSTGTLIVPRGAAGGSLVVQMRGADGSPFPLAGAELVLQVTGEGWKVAGGTEWIRVFTDSDGRAEIPYELSPAWKGGSLRLQSVFFDLFNVPVDSGSGQVDLKPSL